MTGEAGGKDMDTCGWGFECEGDRLMGGKEKRGIMDGF